MAVIQRFQLTAVLIAKLIVITRIPIQLAEWNTTAASTVANGSHAMSPCQPCQFFDLLLFGHVTLHHCDELPDETPSSHIAELTSKLLPRMELEGVALNGARRLPKPREKANPPTVLLTFHSLEARALSVSRWKKLAGTPWRLDDDLTPAQQQERRTLWPTYMEKEAKEDVQWQGGDLYVNNRLWKPAPG